MKDNHSMSAINIKAPAPRRTCVCSTTRNSRPPLLRQCCASKLVVHVDAGSPLAWRNEPYYSQLKRWAQKLIEQGDGGMINIYVRNRVIAILPDKDVDLGQLTFGDRISLHKKRSGTGWEYDVHKEPPADAPSK
jgi:hypothetical protein